MMFGRSEEDSASSFAASSWAASPGPEQPATSKAAEHARITRSILPARDSPPPLVGVAPALPESLFNPMLCILFKDLSFLAGSPAYVLQRGTSAKARSKRGMPRYAHSLVQQWH